VRPVKNKSINAIAIVSILLLTTLGGCIRSGIKIVPVPNQEVLVLNADEIVKILKVVGFTNEQIGEYGWSVREGLAKSGAVRVMVDGKVEAGFAIKGDEIYISSLSRGYHIYNINTGWVNANPSMR